MTAAIEIYTRPGCGYCSAAKSLLTRKKAAFTEFDVATDPTLRQQMWDRAGAGSTFPQIFIGETHVGGCDELYALDREGKLDSHARGRKGQFMSADLTFTAAMVQMRTGLLPEANLEQGTKLIREAAAQGADYVLTPEVSNMIQSNRKAMFEHLAAEEDDLSLKAYRALAAELKIHLHIGSLALRASPERAVNRSFLIGPDGDGDRQLRQDPHVRYRSAGRRELSRIRQLPAGRNRRDRRPAVGPHRPDDLLRRAFSGALSRARRKRRVVPHRPFRLHRANRRSALAHAAARPRHRERLLRVRRRPGRHA